MNKESYGLQKEDKVLTVGKTKKADIACRESSGPGINLEEILQLGREDLTRLLWSADRQIHKILRASSTIEEARNRLFKYFDTLERSYFNIYSTKTLSQDQKQLVQGPSRSEKKTRQMVYQGTEEHHPYRARRTYRIKCAGIPLETGSPTFPKGPPSEREFPLRTCFSLFRN